MAGLFDKKQNANDGVEPANTSNLGYSKDEPKTIPELKALLLAPEMPRTEQDLENQSKESRFFAMVTKDMGTSNISDDQVEQVNDFGTAHNVCRMMGLHTVAAFMAAEATMLLNTSKSVKGWQQDKFNEQRGTYEIKGDAKEKLQNAAGVMPR